MEIDSNLIKKTKIASCCFMGLGQLLFLKQYIRGILMMIFEVILILCCTPVFNSIIPVNKEAAELQFYAFPFFDLSGVLSDYHVDGEKVDIKKASVIEKDMLTLRSFFFLLQAAKTVYVTDPVISIIFSEEYMRFINGTVSKEEFIDSYYRRISLYLKERGN